MSLYRIGVFVPALAVALAYSSSAAAAGRVELELATEGNFPLTTQQQWYRLLTDLKVDNLRIRKAIGKEKPEIEVLGAPNSPVYRVIGLLTTNNQLVVPGGRFSSRDRAGLAEWLAKLREGGPDGLKDKGERPFGLTPAQFDEVNADLSRRVDFATEELSVRQAVGKIAGKLQYALLIDRLANEELKSDEPIGEDVRGLSAGTALAYLLRPAGLVLEPRLDARKQPEYLIARGRPSASAWPIGWPSDKPDRDLVPELFEQLNVEIENTPLSETLEAICGRLKTPVLYDHYALARHGIDVDKALVKLPPARLAYAIILRKALHQADLKGEWRIDETGRPLLWVTTLKPVK